MTWQHANSDTIFARASGAGRSGIAVYRMSGPQSTNIADQLMKATQYFHGQARLRGLYSPSTGKLIDKGIVIHFAAPHSFTGEDVFEFHLHGSVAVERAFCEVMFGDLGLRQAEPGEFTLRAFMNGRMDLVEAEGLADLIDAETEQERRLAIHQMEGSASHNFKQLREQVIEIIALVEASIDFADEGDVGEEVLEQARDRMHHFYDHGCTILSEAPLSDQIKSGIKIVLSGAPNAGKSLLFNRLVDEDKAIVTPIAGTTRDLNEAHIELSGMRVILVDSAGLRDSHDPVEQEGIRRAQRALNEASIILWLVDPASPEFPDTEHLAKTWLVINKSDLNQACNIPSYLETRPTFRLSARENTDINTLELELKAFVKNLIPSTVDNRLIQNRHKDVISSAMADIRQAIHLQEAELVAENLRTASKKLGKLTGAIDLEEVLDLVFNRFCVGK